MKKNILFWRLQQMQRRGANLGDRAISDAMFDAIAKAVPDHRFYVFSRNPEFLPAKYNTFSINIFSLKGVFHGFKALLNADLIILGGGTIIQDKSSKAVIAFNMAFPLLALLLRKKIMCYAIGLGGSKEISSWGKWMSRIVLNRCAIITLRDAESAETLQNLSITKTPYKVAADAAILLNGSSDEEARRLLGESGMKLNNGPLIAISVRRVFHRTGGVLPVSIRIRLGLMGKEWEQKLDSFLISMARFLDKVVKRYNAHLLFVPMYTGKSFFSTRDDLVTQKVVDHMVHKEAVAILKKAVTPAQIKAVFKLTNLVIAIPLHAAILATTALTPAISLCYADKNFRYMKLLGMEDLLVEANNPNKSFEWDRLQYLVHYCLNHQEELKKKLAIEVPILEKKCHSNIAALLQALEE